MDTAVTEIKITDDLFDLLNDLSFMGHRINDA